MAEFVQQSIEEMIPEMEQMERVGLFTKAETRQILKKRRAYEYKLRRRTKCKEDFLQYIQYEVNLLGLVKERRKRTGYIFKKVEIDISILQRIHKLFRLALVRFKDDIKLWLSYIEFSKSRREKATVSRLFTSLLQMHNKRPDLWIAAAKYEFEYNANSGNARGLLQRGLRFNPESKHLWLEYYRLELLFAEKLRKRKEILGSALPGEEEEDGVLKGEVARVVFQKALDSFQGDINFLLSFIPICHLFDFTSDQEEEIYTILQNLYPDKPQTWDAMARRWLHKQKADTDGGLALDSETMFHQVFTKATQKLQSVDIELKLTKVFIFNSHYVLIGFQTVYNAGICPDDRMCDRNHQVQMRTGMCDGSYQVQMIECVMEVIRSR
ncbi:hypothetical protein ACJMK2_034077 [Sinanodonta woodiana]|uniref:U3 small nucleolar RNA-associated protein 6 N-terminal domain-containing protein n=1 Tax=Sinanodonta woodiana TaxID=1069815 RepID=A0ABD3WR12_SINWO